MAKAIPKMYLSRFVCIFCICQDICVFGKNLFHGETGPNYGFDLTKADVVVVDSVSKTVVPNSSNPYGQVIYIKRGGGWVMNIGTNPMTTVINDAKELPVRISYSTEKSPDARVLLEDNTGTLVEGSTEPLDYRPARPADPIEQQRMQKKIMQHTGFRPDAADFVFENGKDHRVELMESFNPEGLLVEVHHAIGLTNVGAAAVTFLANLAQDGVVLYELSSSFGGSKRLIVYNAGTLLSEAPVVSFKQRELISAPKIESSARKTASDAAGGAAAPQMATSSTGNSSKGSDGEHIQAPVPLAKTQPQLRSIVKHEENLGEGREAKEALQGIVAAVIMAARLPPNRDYSYV